MASEAPTPLPARPSDAEREQLARARRRHSLEGRISLDTFSECVARAYAADSEAELAELSTDLPAGPLRRALAAAASRLSALVAELESAWREPRTARLPLPTARRPLMVVGRARECDCVLADATVSRRHAEIEWRDGSWLLIDLGPGTARASTGCGWLARRGSGRVT
jgi:uncharacterized protein DUF1707/FHA domain-containing protein